MRSVMPSRFAPSHSAHYEEITAEAARQASYPSTKEYYCADNRMSPNYLAAARVGATRAPSLVACNFPVGFLDEGAAIRAMTATPWQRGPTTRHTPAGHTPA